MHQQIFFSIGFLTLVSFGLVSASEAAEKKIQMKSISFDPKSVELREGDSVVWTNVSYTEHSATADDHTFDTGQIGPKKNSKAVSFPKAGTYHYQCSIHGKSMSGTIDVHTSK